MAKLVPHDKLREYVQDRLAGLISRPMKRTVGPETSVPGPRQELRHCRGHDQRAAGGGSSRPKRRPPFIA